MTSESRNIVIVGGGIVGCSTAYYIANHPSFTKGTDKITVLEASKHGIAQGASGKAGGLVARWAYPKELVNVSFEEHVRLAEEHNGKDRWGWRFVNCGSWEGRGDVCAVDSGTGVGQGGKRKSLEKTLGLNPQDAPHSRKSKGLPDDLLWVEEGLTDTYSPMAATGHTAQVHPYLFTTSMMDLAREKGADLILGRATGVEQKAGHVTGVTFVDNDTGDTKTLSATHVVLSAGAWSSRVLSELPITKTRAHSVTIHPQPGVTIAPYVLFTEITLPKGARSQTVTPEIYARPDNEVYACGPGDDSALPATVDEVQVDEAACESVRKHVASISPALREGTVDKRQACFLPIVSAGGGPIVGEAAGIAKGLIIATGHTCWGICNAPGTAKALSELVFQGKIKCANLKKLHPSNFV
ncbi:FAD dependent oxidoreductase [Schizophyllum amplum]|uniref:FAD dependent oxidoreductase n=1 Tax=Schizophyllum amplum TaxID=97359 RepID=A0A550CQ24_9AGAR|nr:FAD dependent oxidoreductase [Auriculariopsis ampla]